MTEQTLITLIEEIGTIIVGIGLLATCIILTIIFIKEYKKERQERKEYLNTLTDEERATIGKYIANTK